MCFFRVFAVVLPYYYTYVSAPCVSSCQYIKRRQSVKDKVVLEWICQSYYLVIDKKIIFVENKGGWYGNIYDNDRRKDEIR